MKKKSHIVFAKDSSSHLFYSVTQDSSPNDFESLQTSNAYQIYTPNTDEIGIRADIFVSKILQISRSKVEKLFTKGQILLNGLKLYKQGVTLKAQDRIAIPNLPQLAYNSLLANSFFIDSNLTYKTKSKDFKIPILYQDEDLLVLNKPAGLIVHRANEQDSQYTLVNWLQSQNFPLSNLGDSYRTGIVHRLDKGTSGAIVIAKNNFTHQNLKSQLQMRQMGRYYLCVIDRALKESQIVDSPIVRHSINRLKYITTNPKNPNAKPAKTAFFKIASTHHNQLNYELIGAKLFSGRTHQIRVHLNSLNRHILGDFFYGYQYFKPNQPQKEILQDKILLHSHLLYLKHPRNGKILHIYAPLFKEMQDFLNSNFDLKPYQDSYANLTFPLDKLYQSTFLES